MPEHLTPALKLIKDRPATSSVDVATYFSKQHKNVLRQIRQIIEQCQQDKHGLKIEPMFMPATIAVKLGNGAVRKESAYYLTKDGFALLAMGFTGPKAMRFKIAYIEAFNAMEAELTAPKTVPKPEPEPKARRGRKAIPTPDPAERQLETLLDKVRFYIREVSEVEKQVDAILLSERNKSRQGQFSTDCPQDQVYLNLSCSQRTLWSSIDFGLKAVEENVKAVVAVCRI